MKYLHAVTPATISDELLKLCKKAIDVEDMPFYVDCHPLPNAPIRECFPVVEARVKEVGGAILYG